MIVFQTLKHLRGNRGSTVRVTAVIDDINYREILERNSDSESSEYQHIDPYPVSTDPSPVHVGSHQLHNYRRFSTPPETTKSYVGKALHSPIIEHDLNETGSPASPGRVSLGAFGYQQPKGCEDPMYSRKKVTWLNYPPYGCATELAMTGIVVSSHLRVQQLFDPKRAFHF